MKNGFRHFLAFVAITAFVLFVGRTLKPVNDNGEYFLYRPVQAMFPSYFPLDQGNIGSCVAVAHKGAVDGTQAVERAAGKASAVKPVSAESIYGGIRNEVKGVQVGPRAGDGANGFNAAKWLTTGGVVYQQPYKTSKASYDLSAYNVNLCREWGAYGNGGRADGLDGPLDDEAKKHLVRAVAKVTNLAELDAALKNGYFVTVCSGQGFNSPRDKDGFCRPAGSWAHCMLISGKRQGGRVGYLFQNSWNKYIKGDDGDPKNPSDNQYKDQPDGSFYAEPAITLRMLQAGDSWAISGQTGFERRLLPDWLLSADASVPQLTAADADDADAEEESLLTDTDDSPYAVAYREHTMLRKPLVVFVTAKWCGGPCKTTRAEIARAANLGDVAFAEVDYDADSELVKAITGNSSVPQLVVFTFDAAGQTLKKIYTGKKSAAEVEAIIREATGGRVSVVRPSWTRKQYCRKESDHVALAA